MVPRHWSCTSYFVFFKGSPCGKHGLWFGVCAVSWDCGWCRNVRALFPACKRPRRPRDCLVRTSSSYRRWERLPAAPARIHPDTQNPSRSPGSTIAWPLDMWVSLSVVVFLLLLIMPLLFLLVQELVLILPIMALLLLLWVMELLVLAKLLVFLFGSVFIGS